MVLSKSLYGPFSFGTKHFSPILYFVHILVISLRDKRESCGKMMERQSYGLTPFPATKKLFFMSMHSFQYEEFIEVFFSLGLREDF